VPVPVIVDGSEKSLPPLPINPLEKKPPVAPPRNRPVDAMPAWRLPNDAAVKEIAVSPHGVLLLRDEKGGVWLWYSNAPTDTVRNVTPPTVKSALFCDWAKSQVAAAVGADGALYTLDIPANERGMLQPWTSRTKVDPGLSALAAGMNGERPLVAFAKGNDIQFSDDKNGMTSNSLNEPVLALQYLKGGVLLCASQSSAHAWMSPSRGIKFSLGDSYALAVCASDAPFLALIPEKKRNEIHFIRPQLDSGKGDRMTIDLRANITNLALSPGGMPIAAVTERGEVILVGGQSNILARFHAGEAAIQSLAFSPDAKRLYAATEDGAIHVWNVEK